LDDVVLKNRGAAEGAKNADGEHRDGDGSGNGKPGAKTDIDGDGSEKQPKKRAKDYRAKGEFLDAFFRRYIRAEFPWRGRGTPWTFAQENLLVFPGKLDLTVCGDYAAGEQGGEAIPAGAAACACSSLDTSKASLYCPALYSTQVGNTAMLGDPSKPSKHRTAGSHYLPVNLQVARFLEIQSGGTP
jgi:hypothetical protein